MRLKLAMCAVFFRVGIPSGLGEKHQNHLTGHVVGREQRREKTNNPQARALVPSVQENFVLRPESGEGWNAGNRQPTNNERDGGDRHELAQHAHLAHVLLFVHPVDHRPRPKEHQRLKEGVGNHMEDGRHVSTGSNRQEHVAELADRGVCEHFLDVVLCNSNGCGKECGRCANNGNNGARLRNRVEHGRHAHHQEHTGGNHGGGVDECRNRRGPLHCVGQPHIERELRRLAAGANERKERNRQCGRVRQRWSCFFQGEKVERSESLEGKKHCHHETPVTNAIGNESFLAGHCRRVAGVPEADEEVRTRTNALPTKEGNQHVGAEHQHQHRKDEQVQIEKELGELRVTVHVTDSKHVDEGADTGDEEGHRDRQWVGQEGQVDVEPTRAHPGEKGAHMLAFFNRLGDQVKENRHRCREGSARHKRGQPPGHRFAETPSEHQDQHEAE